MWLLLSYGEHMNEVIGVILTAGRGVDKKQTQSVYRNLHLIHRVLAKKEREDKKMFRGLVGITKFVLHLVHAYKQTEALFDILESTTFSCYF